MKRLVAHTILRLEALRYRDDIFSESNPINGGGGWSLLLSKDFDGCISSEEMLSFIEKVKSIIKSSDGDKFRDFDTAHVMASLFTRYRCTVDSIMLGFIVKNKISFKVEDVATKRGFFAKRFVLWMWNGFKRLHNGILDSLRIG